MHSLLWYWFLLKNSFLQLALITVCWGPQPGASKSMGKKAHKGHQGLSSPSLRGWQWIECLPVFTSPCPTGSPNLSKQWRPFAEKRVVVDIGVVDIVVVGVDEWPPLNGKSKHSRLQKNHQTCFKKNCKNAKLWEREKKSFFAKERLLSLFCNDDEKPEKTWIYDHLNQWLPFERWTLELDVSRLAAVVSVTLIWFFK